MKYILYVYALAFLLSLAGYVQAYATENAGENVQGVLMQIKKDANLRRGPGHDYPVVATLAQGTQVIRYERRGAWAAVVLKGGDRKGWVHVTLLQRRITESTASSRNAGFISKTVKHSAKPDSSAADNSGMASKIGVIDIQQVIEQSRKGRAARSYYRRLKEEKGEQYGNDMEKKLITKLLIEIRKVVQSVAEKEGFTHVINENAGGLVFSREQFDITDEVVKEYDRLTGENITFDQ